MKKNKTFDSTDQIIGQEYETAFGKKFKVIDAEPYPTSKVSGRYEAILYFPQGNIVAVLYRGTFIPNITLVKGVARLIKIEIDGTVISRPGAISKALGIKDEMVAYKIK